MKTRIRYFSLALSLVAMMPAVRAADDKPTAADDKKELRVLAPGRARRVLVAGDEGRKMEKETVAFLGVETGSVSATTSSQLGLPRGTGLVVNHILPKSPAAGVLNEHDILLKLDDQILIETRQLAVLIRNHKEGDEVEITYMRGGQKATTKVKLGKHEGTKMSADINDAPRPFGWAAGVGPHFEMPPHDVLENREDVDRLLSLIQRARPAPDAPNGAIPPPVRIQIDHDGGPGFRAMAVHTGNSNLVFSDGEGSLELTLKDGAKTLMAKDPKGEVLFSGPVNTGEQRKALPVGLRARLEKLEGMRDITFHTDGDFSGPEVRVMRPRGIALPLPGNDGRRPVPPSLFY